MNAEKIIEIKRRMVKAYFFWPSGKWKETHRMLWIKDGYLMQDIYEAFALSLRARFTPYSVTLQALKDLDVICFEPYHKNAHPVQFKNGEWINYGIDAEEPAETLVSG